MVRAPAESRAVLPNRAFDPGHGPESHPLGRRDDSIARSPLVAPPGPCRSMLALGPPRAPVHEACKDHMLRLVGGPLFKNI